LSTLTKVLIVLLTLSSIFLCGIVVTYVANAENYKDMWEKVRVQKEAAVKNEIQAQKELNDIRDEMDTQKTELDEKNAKLERDVERLKNDLKEAEILNVKLIDEAGKWKAITREFYDTNEKQGQRLEDTLDKLKKLEAEQIQADKELNETTAALREKMAIIGDLEEQSKLLLKEKTALQNELDRLFQQSGKAIAPPVPVTPIKEKARVAPPVFICDIVILDVEPEKAIGTLELMDVTKEQPKAGDNVSTNL